MVSGTPAQAKHSTTSNNMWAVVVLGIITAVFAWVWFGGRGSEKKRSEIGDKSSAKSHTDDSQRNDSSVTALTSQEDHAGDPETQEESPGSSHPPDNGAGHTAGEERLVNFNEKGTELYRDQELNPIESNTREGKDVYGQDDRLSKSHTMEEQLTPVDAKTLEGEDLMANSTEDVHYFTAPEKEVVQISRDILQTIAKEDLEQTQVEVNHSTGLEKQGVQVNEDLSTSVAEDKELLCATEEVYPSVGQSGGQVEDLKPVATEKKLKQTIEETNHLIVADNVVPIRAETVAGFTHPVQDGNVKLVNGGEEHFQKEKATVSPEGNVTKGNALNVTVSPKQVNRSSVENTFDQYNHNKLESYEQSQTDCVVNEKPSATLESAADVQVTGHIVQTNKLSEVSIPSKLEDVDKCAVLLHSSDQKEESPDFKWLSSGDNICLATLSEAKLYDLDSQRTKRVAAVQPIPQNVSLAFKVHYIALSDSQMIAVTGDHEKLGEWENYVPLTSDKDGYWSHSVTLPADANIEWKFVMVENGKIRRWEECTNRHVRTAHEDIPTEQCWGYP